MFEYGHRIAYETARVAGAPLCQRDRSEIPFRGTPKPVVSAPRCFTSHDVGDSPRLSRSDRSRSLVELASSVREARFPSRGRRAFRPDPPHALHGEDRVPTAQRRRRYRPSVRRRLPRSAAPQSASTPSNVRAAGRSRPVSKLSRSARAASRDARVVFSKPILRRRANARNPYRTRNRRARDSRRLMCMIASRSVTATREVSSRGFARCGPRCALCRVADFPALRRKRCKRANAQRRRSSSLSSFGAGFDMTEGAALRRRRRARAASAETTPGIRYARRPERALSR